MENRKSKRLRLKTQSAYLALAIICRRKAKSNAFTLIELLVTIGIITVLIGILVPVANGIRKTAKATVTQQLITSIEAAINLYQQETSDWPGPFDNLPYDRTDTTVAWNTVGGIELHNVPAGTDPTYKLRPTRSEELLLSLSGGLGLTRQPGSPFTPTDFFFDPQNLDRGQQYLGLKTRGRMHNMMSNAKVRNETGTGPLGQFGDPADNVPLHHDTLLPEFVDSFEMPILYVRAIKGVNDTTAYYRYNLDSDPVISDGPLWYEALRYVPQANILFPPTYLQSDTLQTNTAPHPTRNANTYILISAGPDKKFGTADDITNFGPPKMPAK